MTAASQSVASKVLLEIPLCDEIGDVSGTTCDG